MLGQARRTSLAAIIAASLLSGCAAQHVAPIAAVHAPVIPPRPAPPEGFAAVPVIPALADDGSYVTPNAALTPAETMWHLRAALNVAALACRGPEEAALAKGYNGVLARQRAPLAHAYAAIRSQDRVRYGKGWEAGHDAQMTRLYNYFAQPFATPAFCVAAGAVMARAGATDPAAFPGAAGTMLAALDAPFTDGYRRYDAYRTALADWDTRYGTANAAPRLAYAPFETILVWTPAPRGAQLAAAAQ